MTATKIIKSIPVLRLFFVSSFDFRFFLRDSYKKKKQILYLHSIKINIIAYFFVSSLNVSTVYHEGIDVDNKSLTKQFHNNAGNGNG